MPERRRPCATCGRNRREDFFVSAKGKVCSDCRKKRQRETARRNHVERTYGLTPEDHAWLLDYSDGCCQICDGERPYELAIDHDHTNGRVRGLLCKRCNKLLRDVRDRPEILRAAALYLEHTPADYDGITAVHKDFR